MSSEQPEWEAIVVFVTAPAEEEAAAIARALVEAKLAACVSIINNVRSIYSWQGNIEDDAELLMIVKTRKSLFAGLSAKIRELHSYDVPEIIALPVTESSNDYLEWLHNATAK